MSDLIERLRKGDVSGKLSNEAASRLESQQAEIAEYKKQIKQMGSSVQHYEHLAMKFSSQADVYSHDRQRAWAEIARLREALPSDVVRLVIAARTIALGDWFCEGEDYEIARKELDDASEAFASRVEWPDTPDDAKHWSKSHDRH